MDKSKLGHYAKSARDSPYITHILHLLILAARAHAHQLPERVRATAATQIMAMAALGSTLGCSKNRFHMLRNLMKKEQAAFYLQFFVYIVINYDVHNF